MKHLIVSFVVALFAFGSVIPDAEARRFGGGGNFGMQRQMSPQAPRQATPAQSPARQQAGAQNRSWMGPVAGLAAGLGLAALVSHLGLGEEFASLLLIALLAFGALMLVRMLGRRAAAAQDNGRMQFAAQGAEAGARPRADRHAMRDSASSAGPAAPATRDDFDVDAFVRQAKVNFIRLQAAHDEANLADIRQFTTPEMFAEIRIQMADSPVGAVQRTDVVDLEAEVVDVVEEASRYVVSVRFSGLLREDPELPPQSFAELWHMVKERDGSRGWVIAGIQQAA